MKKVVCMAIVLICGIVFVAGSLRAEDAKEDKPPAKILEMTAEKQYLNVPVKRGSKGRKMTINVDGKLLGEYWIGLGEEDPDWWAFFDIKRFKGKKIEIKMDPGPEDMGVITQDDEIKGGENMYEEKYRPRFHFSSKRGWLNDPNGMVWYKGEYHLYYQHNPVAIPWGNMTWGHAVSKDMVHWEELPKVLFPDPKTGTCYSGAGFMDTKNELGFKTGDEDVMVAFYLRTKIGLCLAYSNDRGRTMTDYGKNPVLTHEGARIDTPRPFYYEPTKRWIAPTYDHFVNKEGKKLRAVGFYSSKDLKEWKYESRVTQKKWGDELCGCADFFQLPIDGDQTKKKWVLVLIDGSYIVGTFDGSVFYNMEGKPAITDDADRSLVICGNFYATQTFHDSPDGRRVQMTWMRGPEHPGMPFNQQMTLPVELTLHSADEGPKMRMNPIKELQSLRTKTYEFKNVVLSEGENPLSKIEGDIFEVEVEFEPVADSQTVIDLRGHKVAYDAKTQMLTSGNLKSPLKPIKGVVSLRIYLDRSSIEVFGNEGRVYMPLRIIPADDNRSLSASCAKGEVKANYIRVHELKSAWK